MSTQKQREANLRNAQFSCGPATATEKAASSHNALRYGIFASDLTLLDDPETSSEIQSKLTEYCDYFQPANPLERDLIEEIPPTLERDLIEEITLLLQCQRAPPRRARPLPSKRPAKASRPSEFPLPTSPASASQSGCNASGTRSLDTGSIWRAGISGEIHSPHSVPRNVVSRRQGRFPPGDRLSLIGAPVFPTPRAQGSLRPR